MTGTNALIPVEFHGSTLYSLAIDGVPHVALRPIVQALGLDWKAQHARITRHPVLSTCVVVTTTQMPGDDQAREVFFLPLDKLNGWLFGVSVNRVRPELRAKLIQYQAECFDVLARHFMPEEKPYSVQPGQTLSAEQAQILRDLLLTHAKRLPKRKQAAAMIRGWSKLKAHFHTGYRHIPASQFSEAVSILVRHTAEYAEWELLDEEPAKTAPSIAPPIWTRPIPAGEEGSRGNRTVVQLRDIITHLSLWAEHQPFPNETRRAFWDALADMEGLITTSQTEIQEALGQIAVGVHYLNRWRGARQIRR